MPYSSLTPLVPNFDVTVHIVLDDYGKAGRVYRETDEAQASFETVVDDLLTGQFNNPVRVVAFNTSEAWARDVSEDVAREVVKRVVERGRPLAASSRTFIEAFVDEDELLHAESGVA
jgi:(2Fe-2S) ferredoxin